jgi:hypothetical protein
MRSLPRISLLMLSVLFMVGLSIRHDQTVSATRPTHAQDGGQGCVDGKDTVRRAWAIEEQLTQLGMSSTPATSARTAYKKADDIEHQLLQCEVAAYAAHEQEQKDMYSAERTNLQFIATSQIAYGGLASLPNPKLPSDLSSLAAACKEVLASNLPDRIENFARVNRDASALKSKDVADLYSEANPSERRGLTICAEQARNIGYKDAAFRLLTDVLTIENLMHIATLNGQASIIKAFGSARQNTPVFVEVGPRHCTATVRDWGWQKSVDWDCF